MADFTSIAAVGSSLVRYLTLCFTDVPPVTGRATAVNLIRTEDLNRESSQVITAPSLSLFLYRADFNKTMRAAWSAVGHRNGESHLPLDLHYLFIAWGENADQEHRILGRAMQCMEDTPILSGPLLDPITDWAGHESIQVCLEELTTEDLMRTFDSLPSDYKLCAPYVARIAVIDGRVVEPDLPVTRASILSTPEVDDN